MSLQYIGLKAISGPLVFLEGIVDVGYEEMVQIQLESGEIRHGRVIHIEDDKVAVQVFEGTNEMTIKNTKTTFTGEPLMLRLSKEVLGRTFNGAGKPIDGLGPVFSDQKRDINGLPINPVSRVYPRNYIHTGVSAIDVLTTLIRGQKLPIFSATGLTHNELAVQLVKNAKLSADSTEKFCVVFAAMGVKHDVAEYFRVEFESAHVMDRTVMFINLANDPIIERILTPRAALTTAEYLAFEHGFHVLVILTDMTAYAEALREFSSSKGEIPGRKGYPGYLYSDLSSLYERAGMVTGKKGSVTQIPILTMPNEDITHPVPDLTGFITEGQIVLDKALKQKGVFPPISVLPSLSRLMKDGIGKAYTRIDHQSLSNQLFASYARVQEIKALASVIGEDELSEIDKTYMLFGKLFDEHFLNQGDSNRTLEHSLDLGWHLLSLLPESELSRLKSEEIKSAIDKERALKFFHLSSDNLIHRILRKG